MLYTDKIKINSIVYFLISLFVRWFYNLIILFYHGFTGNEKLILHLILAVASLVFGWLALQLFRRSNSSGSNLGCTYLFLLVLNIIGGIGALFFCMVQFFSDQGGAETLWLL